MPRPVEMVPLAFMESQRDRAEMYRDQLACAQQKILQQKARLRELERLQAKDERIELLASACEYIGRFVESEDAERVGFDRDAWIAHVARLGP